MMTRSSTATRGISRAGLLLVCLPLLLLIIAALGSMVWWQFFKTSPSYSLALLVDASQQNDAQAFDEVFDTQKVVENFVNDGAMRTTNSPDFAASLTQRIQPVSAPVAESVKPIVRKRLQERINELGPAANLPFFLKALGIRLKTNVDQENDKTRAVISHDNRQLELWLAPNGEKWKVIAVKDDQLAAEVVTDIARRLPGARLPVTIPKGLTLPDVEKLIPQR